MKLRILSTLLCLVPSFTISALSIEECVEKAIGNYPSIEKYHLIAATSELELSDINKGWLPRIGVYGQATVQNVVPAFPESLSGVLKTLGQDMKGLGKFQYKVGIDVSQTIWDGGVSKRRREMSRKQEAVQQATLDVELYKVRERVENLYFAILLTEQQIAQAQVNHQLLCDNLKTLRSMLANGVAMQSDVDMVEAQALAVNQTIIQAQTASDSYRRVLEIFIGEPLGKQSLEMPEVEIPDSQVSNRPELRLFERRLEYNRAAGRLADTSLMPRVGLFAQTYYGYPGINYFQNMINRDLSFNIVAGVKVSWNIDSFYTKNNSRRRTAINASDIEVERDVFLFNSDMQAASQSETIRGIRDMMKEDSRIIALRTNVRKAAEAQLANGVIDITALLTKISDENLAILTSRYHEIQLLQEIYKLKYTLDR